MTLERPRMIPRRDARLVAELALDLSEKAWAWRKRALAAEKQLRAIRKRISSKEKPNG